MSISSIKEGEMITTSYCDYGHEAKAARLDTGGNSGAFLCRKHWAEEMKWRKLRNEKLEPQNQFDILPYPANTLKPDRRKVR